MNRTTPAAGIDKATPITPYGHTNSISRSTLPSPYTNNGKDIKQQGNVPSAGETSAPQQLSPSSIQSNISIANSSESATLNEYIRRNEEPRHHFFGSDLVRNPDGK